MLFSTGSATAVTSEVCGSLKVSEKFTNFIDDVLLKGNFFLRNDRVF